jgi:hypothetical protein
VVSGSARVGLETDSSVILGSDSSVIICYF